MIDCMYERDIGDLPESSSTHLRLMKPAEVMVWALVASDGSQSLSVLIEDGVKVNTKDCIQMLTEKALP